MLKPAKTLPATGMPPRDVAKTLVFQRQHCTSNPKIAFVLLIKAYRSAFGRDTLIASIFWRLKMKDQFSLVLDSCGPEAFNTCVPLSVVCLRRQNEMGVPAEFIDFIRMAEQLNNVDLLASYERAAREAAIFATLCDMRGI